jgi:hypothetical protein
MNDRDLTNTPANDTEPKTETRAKLRLAKEHIRVLGVRTSVKTGRILNVCPETY